MLRYFETVPAPTAWWQAPELDQESLTAQILCVGDNSVLLMSRVLLLKRAGYDVLSCNSDDSRRLPATYRFSVALICRSVQTEKGILAATTLRNRSPLAPVVRLCSPRLEDSIFYDSFIESTLHPETFLQDMKELLEQIM